MSGCPKAIASMYDCIGCAGIMLSHVNASDSPEMSSGPSPHPLPRRSVSAERTMYTLTGSK